MLNRFDIAEMSMDDIEFTMRWAAIGVGAVMSLGVLAAIGLLLYAL
jgi:hypothetical protein